MTAHGPQLPCARIVENKDVRLFDKLSHFVLERGLRSGHELAGRHVPDASTTVRQLRVLQELA
jgi:hypothetical protein